jgi:hypothetical protein
MITAISNAGTLGTPKTFSRHIVLFEDIQVSGGVVMVMGIELTRNKKGFDEAVLGFDSNKIGCSSNE